MSDAPSLAGSRKPAAERILECVLFNSRWLMIPMYLGLVVTLGALAWVFVLEAWHELSQIATMKPARAIMLALSLIDISLAGNLVLIVIFSGYENFVSKLDTGDNEDRPSWISSIDFSGLKLKLIASIVAISAILMLRGFMQLVEGDPNAARNISWLVLIHLTLVFSGVLLALMDWLIGRTPKH